MLQKAYIEITNCCNLSCSFCHGTKRTPKFMTMEEFDILTDKLRGKMKYIYFHLLGEPLLHPLFTEFVQMAYEKGFVPMLTTNGTLLSKRGQETAGLPFHKVSISLHAPEANGAFASTEYLDGCVNFAKTAGKNGTITVMRLWNQGGLDAGNAGILQRLRESFPNEWKESRNGMKIAEQVYIEYGEKFDWPDMAAEEYDTSFMCYALRDQIGILCDGTVVPCCLDAEGNIPLGNLFEKELEEITGSERARAIYDGFSAHRAVEPLCRRCGYAAKTKRYREK